MISFGLMALVSRRVCPGFWQICGGFCRRGAPPRSLKWQRGLQQCRCCRPSALSGIEMQLEAPPISCVASPVLPGQISCREKQAAGTSRLHEGSFHHPFPQFNPGIEDMRGLLPLYRGLYCLRNRRSVAAAAVGSRLGFCGAQSSTKVRSVRLLHLSCSDGCPAGRARCLRR